MSAFAIGQTIHFRRPDGTVVSDVVRACFMQTTLLEPYARNRTFPALVLTNHSWCAEDDVIERTAQ